MRKLLLALALLAAFAIPTQAQNSTTVTVNVTDAGGQTWNNGTYQFQFVGPTNVTWPGGAVARTISGTLSGSGSATPSIPSNATITPSPTFWTVYVCPNPSVTAGPSGCFTLASQSIGGATQTINVTPPAIVLTVPTTPTQINPVVAYADAEISGGWVGFTYYSVTSSSNRQCTAVSATSCTTWAASGGTSTVSSLPPTCTAGVTAPVNLVIGTSAYGIFTCGTSIGGTNVWIPSNPSQTVSPLAYGAKADVKFVYDATFTNSSGNVSCGQNDCNFTQADVGKIVQGFSLQNSTGGASQATVLAQTTIQTVTDASHIVTVGTALAGCTPASAQLCSLAWGTQADDAAMALAATAAWSTPGVCRAIQLPTGNMFFANAVQPLLFVSAANLSSACGGPSGTVSGIDTSQTGPEVYGQGPGNTLFIPLTTLDFTKCNAGGDAKSCGGGTPNMEAHDFGINGLGFGLATTTHNNYLFSLEGSPNGGGCTGSTGFNLSFSQWGAQSTSSIGINIGQGSCGDPTYTNIISEGFGAINCQLNANNVVMTVVGLACFGNSNGSVKIVLQSGGILNTSGSYFGGLQVASTAVVNVAGMLGTSVWNSTGDNIHPQQPLAGETAIIANGAGSGTINLLGDFLDLNSGTTSTSQIIFLSSATINVNARNSVFLATGTNNKIMNLGSGSTFTDGGGNSFTNGTVANTLSGTVINSPSEPSFGGRCLLASQASPEPCVAASNGKVAIPASQATYTINTVAVQSGSTITITPTTDNTGISGAPTCTLPTNTAIPSISASVAGTSFTIAETSTASITCYDWSIR